MVKIEILDENGEAEATKIKEKAFRDYDGGKKGHTRIAGKYNLALKPFEKSNNGIVVGNQIFPMFKKGNTTLKLLKSHLSKDNRIIFNKIYDILIAIQDPKERLRRYVKAVVKATGLKDYQVKAIYDIANTYEIPQMIKQKLKDGFNLFNQKVLSIFKGDTPVDNPQLEDKLNKQLAIEDKQKPLQIAEEENLVAKDRATARGVENIANRNLYVERIKNAEFGIYFRGRVYPLFKDIKTSGHENTWSLVSGKRNPEEIDLFKRMSKMSNEDAHDEYYNFMMARGIPEVVINRAVDIADQIAPEKMQLIAGTLRRFEKTPNINEATLVGINLKEIDFNNETGLVSRMLRYVNREILKRVTKDDLAQQKRIEDSGKIRRKKPPQKQIEDLKVIDEDSGKEQDLITGEVKGDNQPSAEDFQKAEARKRFLEAMEKKPAPAPEPAPTPSPPTPAPTPTPTPPPSQPPSEPPRPPASEPSPEEIARGEAERARDKAGDVQEEEAMREQLERDFIPDVSKFGHTMAVQNIFTRYNKDFTYFKNLVANSELKPSNDKKVRKMQVDRIIAEYSSLLPIEKVNSDYTYEECLEIVALKFTYIQNVRFENSWKRSLINFNMPNNNNIGNMQRALIVQQPMGTLGQMGVAQMPNKDAPKEEPQPPMRTKQTSRSGKVPAREHNIVAKPQMIKPKNTPKKQKIFNDRPMILNIRKRRIPDKLLYTNLKHQPNQQNMQQPGNLPVMRVKDRVKKNRFKL